MSEWLCGPECPFWGPRQMVLDFAVHYCMKGDKPTVEDADCDWTLAEMERDLALTAMTIAARKAKEGTDA